jgi:hypothetical protein
MVWAGVPLPSELPHTLELLLCNETCPTHLQQQPLVQSLRWPPYTGCTQRGIIMGNPRPREELGKITFFTFEESLTELWRNSEI